MTDQDFDFIRKLLRERSAIVLEDGKQYLVESRLAPIVRELKLDSIGDLVALLRAPLSQRPAAASRRGHGDHRDDVLPRPAPVRGAAQGGDPGPRSGSAQNERRLNIWCAACSTGQEPYSLALLFREHFPELAGWKVNILATDLSRDVLARRAKGVTARSRSTAVCPRRCW